VEFSALTGGTVAVVSLERTQVLAADHREVTHARRIALRDRPDHWREHRTKFESSVKL
jgi:hypothetical protein